MSGVGPDLPSASSRRESSPHRLLGKLPGEGTPSTFPSSPRRFMPRCRWKLHFGGGNALLEETPASVQHQRQVLSPAPSPSADTHPWAHVGVRGVQACDAFAFSSLSAGASITPSTTTSSGKSAAASQIKSLVRNKHFKKRGKKNKPRTKQPALNRTWMNGGNPPPPSPGQEAPEIRGLCCFLLAHWEGPQGSVGGAGGGSPTPPQLQNNSWQEQSGRGEGGASASRLLCARCIVCGLFFPEPSRTAVISRAPPEPAVPSVPPPCGGS